MSRVAPPTVPLFFDAPFVGVFGGWVVVVVGARAPRHTREIHLRQKAPAAIGNNMGGIRAETHRRIKA